MSWRCGSGLDYEVPGGQEADSPCTRKLFRVFVPGAVSVRSRVLTGVPSAGADRPGLPHTRLAALAPERWRWQSALSLVRGGRDTVSVPASRPPQGGGCTARVRP